MLKSLVFLAMFAVLAACSARPFQVGAPLPADALAEKHPFNAGKEPRKALWQPVNRVQAISLCYSRQSNTQQEIEETAQEICRGGRIEFYDDVHGWRRCALFQPQQVTYICYPATFPTAKVGSDAD